LKRNISGDMESTLPRCDRAFLLQTFCECAEAIRNAYDGDGNRVAETVGGVTTQYLVDDHNPTGLPQVMDEIVNGAVTDSYTYDAFGMPITTSGTTPNAHTYSGERFDQKIGPISSSGARLHTPLTGGLAESKHACSDQS
jgi:hypothetical protein